MSTDSKKFNLPAYINTPLFLYQDSRLDKTHLLIASFIYSLHTAGKKISVSNSYLQALAGVEKRQTLYALDQLEKMKYIKRSGFTSRRIIEWIYQPESKIVVVEELNTSAVQCTKLVQSSALELVQSSAPIYKRSNIKEDIIKPLVDSSNSTEVVSINIVKDNYQNDSLFRKFYDNYPNKQKPLSAYKAFSKLKPTPEFVDMLVVDLNNRKQNNWKGRDKSKIPHPATYLNAKEWEGEIYSTNQKKESGRKFYTFDEMVGSLTGNEAD